MSFLRKKSIHDSLAIMEAISRVCAIKGGRLCEELYNLFIQGDYLGVMNFHIDYSDPSLNSTDVLYARQIMGLVEKQDFLDIGVDKEQVALDKFIASERNCREVNRRFRTRELPGMGSVDAVLYCAQRKISRILGDVPPLSDLSFSFGPGVNTSVKMTEANPRIKLSASLKCSTNLVSLIGELLAEFPIWGELGVERANSYLAAGIHYFGPDLLIPVDTAHSHVSLSKGKLVFVPKNAKSHRSIIVEPILNGLFQKGVGKYIKDRLALAGLNLSRSGAQEKNQHLARVGSLDGSLATLDLSSASDCISYGLVLELLPLPWFEFLEAGRTGEVFYTDKKGNRLDFELQKFSSMGNAYTFELESLIFWSLSLAVCEVLGLSSENVRSYGDDIIVPVSATSLLIEVLTFCGFSLNKSKSYWSGPFRESCGADFLNGLDIRPFYLKNQINEQTLYIMHNWFFRHGEFELANVVKTFVRPDILLIGPDGYGDGHLIGSYHLRSSRKLRHSGWCGGFFDTYTLKPKRIKSSRHGDWVFPVYSVYVRSGADAPSDADVVRGNSGYAKISIYTLATTVFRRRSVE